MRESPQAAARSSGCKACAEEEPASERTKRGGSRESPQATPGAQRDRCDHGGGAQQAQACGENRSRAAEP